MEVFGAELPPGAPGAALAAGVGLLAATLAAQAQSQYKEVVEAYLAGDAVRAAALRDIDDYLAVDRLAGCKFNFMGKPIADLQGSDTILDKLHAE